MSSLAGQLLVALPDLRDGHFFRSVVLLFRHDSEGTAGLVLNRRTATKVSEAVTDLPAGQIAPGVAAEDLRHCLFWGGPVKGPLMTLHACLAWAELAVLGGVQFSVTARHIREIVTQSRQPFRVYTGYAGWGPGQLEAEIDAGGWLVRPTVADQIFASDPDSMWQQICEKAALEIMLPTPYADADGKHGDCRQN